MLSNFPPNFCDKKAMIFLATIAMTGCGGGGVKNDVLVTNNVLVVGDEMGSGIADCEQLWQKSNVGFYEDNPTYLDPTDHSSDWLFSTPEAQGMDSEVLDA